MYLLLNGVKPKLASKCGSSRPCSRCKKLGLPGLKIKQLGQNYDGTRFIMQWIGAKCFGAFEIHLWSTADASLSLKWSPLWRARTSSVLKITCMLQIRRWANSSASKLSRILTCKIWDCVVSLQAQIVLLLMLTSVHSVISVSWLKALHLQKSWDVTIILKRKFKLTRGKA